MRYVSNLAYKTHVTVDSGKSCRVPRQISIYQQDAACSGSPYNDESSR